MKNPDYNVDLCVIGGAAAGLTAAVRARENGVEKVMVLDKMPNYGGASRMAGGFFACGTEIQATYGQQDVWSPDEAFEDFMGAMCWDCDAKLVRRWFNGTAEIIRYYQSKGIPIDRANPDWVEGVDYRGKCHRTYHYVDGYRTGAMIIDKMAEDCERMNVPILVNTKATELIQDDSGAIVGVRAEKEGKPIEIQAKAVAICTGTISGNMDLIERFFPGKDYSKAPHMFIASAMAPFNDGDGLLMAEKVGAKVGDISRFSIAPHNHPYDMRVGNFLRRPHGIWLNKNGERFVDESLQDLDARWWQTGVALDWQPDKTCFDLMDSDTFDAQIANPVNYNGTEELQGRSNPDCDPGAHLDEGHPTIEVESNISWILATPESIKKEAAAGRVLVADTLEEVAQFIGCDVENLKATVDEYNQFCDRGHDAEFLKRPQFLNPIRKPPYYVIEGWQGFDSLIGGIRINHHMQVLNQDLRPIPGLYGAGVCTSGWLGGYYNEGGTGLSFVAYSGYTMGAEVAQYLKKKEA
jgi:fumarate reductase flavoprotein subunit